MPTDLFEAMLVFYHGDGRPAFLGNFRWLENLVGSSSSIDNFGSWY
jgi:hypothetical protein